MFEEANLYNCSQYSYSQSNDTYLESSKHSCSTISLTLSQGKTAVCQHKLHPCIVHLWVAQGLVKKYKEKLKNSTQLQKKWFLYIEYQDRTENNRYLQKSFNTQSEAWHYAETEALNETLPMY